MNNRNKRFNKINKKLMRKKKNINKIKLKNKN